MLRHALPVLGEEPLGPEPVRLPKVALVPVHDPGADQDPRARLDRRAAELEGRGRCSILEVRNRVEPEGFIDDGPDKRDALEVGDGQRAGSHLRVYRLGELVLDVGMLREECERPRERERGRLLTGEEERVRLVADRVVVERCPVFFDPAQERAEEIVAGVRARPAPRDDRVDGCVEVGDGTEQRVVGRSRRPEPQVDEVDVERLGEQLAVGTASSMSPE